MIGIILLVGLILRIILSFFGTYWGDLNCWIGWSNRLLEVGFKNFYQSWSDYLPGYLYVLWFLGKTKNYLEAAGINLPNEILFKLPAIFADLGTGFLIYKLIVKFRNKKIALMAGGIYLINPAIWGNSALWGQVDGFFAFFLLWAFYLLWEEKYRFSAVIFGLSCIIKPLAFIFFPLILLYLYLKKRNLLSLLTYGAVSLFCLILPFTPFNNGNLLGFIISRFQATLNQYPYTSLNAFNFWGLVLPSWTKDSLKFFILSYQNWGWLLFGISYCFVLWRLIKILGQKKVNKEQEFYLFISSIAIVFFASVMFLTRIHERHLLPVFPFLNIIAVFNPLVWITYFAGSLIYVLNLRYAFVWLTDNFKTIYPPLIIHLLAGLQLVNFLFLYFFSSKVIKKSTLERPRSRVDLSRLFCKIRSIGRIRGLGVIGERGDFRKEKEVKVKKEVKIKRGGWYLGIILLTAFILRIWNLWYPKAYIFDEVYHGFTAQEIAKGNPKAFEWWNPSPKGFAYEWTHPYLAKLIMAGSVILFGVNNQQSQWVFRFPAVLFGVGSIYLLYLLGKIIFKSERIGLIAAFLLTFDGLHFVMSRVGMIDIYFLFFMLGTIYLTLKEKYFWAGIWLGLACSSKWTGMYIFPVVGVILLSKFLHLPGVFNSSPGRWNLAIRHLGGVICFALIPPLIYLLVHLPFFSFGHTWKQFEELNKQMWWYHTHLKATHSYQSKAYTWPLMIRPVWFWVDYQKDKIGNIYNLGNPFLWWSGVLILGWVIWQTARQFLHNFRRPTVRQFLHLGGERLRHLPGVSLAIFCYFAFWLPWIGSPRIMFLHHYLPSVPFLCLIIGWFLSKIQNSEFRIQNFKIKGKLLITVYCLLVTLTFLFFYPIYTGILLPAKWLKWWFWLGSWR